MGRLRALIVGLGSAGQRHARNLRKLLGDEIDLAAFRVRDRQQVISPNMDLIAEADLSSTYGITLYRKFHDATKQKPDFAIIANPNHLHMECSLELAKMGCHLFIEKPISHNLRGIESLKKLTEKQKLTVFVAYQMRFHPGYKLLKNWIDSHRLGRVLNVQMVFGEYLPGWHPYEDYRGYHAARSDQGGGVLLSQIHDLDFLSGLFGLPESVFAVGGKFTSLEIDVEDTVDLLCRYQTLGYPFAVSVHQDYQQNPPQRWCEINGEKGRARWDYYQQILSFTPHGGQPEITHFDSWDRNEMFLKEMNYFLDCIKQKETPFLDIDEGCKSLRFALAAKQSLETGKVVTI